MATMEVSKVANRSPHNRDPRNDNSTVKPSNQSDVSSGKYNSRWQKAISTILATNQGEEPPPDPLGDFLTAAFNRNLLFRGGSFKQGADPVHFSYPPLISRQNLSALARRLSLLWKASCHPKRSINESIRYIFEYKRSAKKTIVFFLLSVLFLGLLVVGISHLLVTIAVRASIILTSYFFVLLLDWRDFEPYVPRVIKILFGAISKAALWIDAYLLGRKRFAGREWNRDAFCFNDTHKAQSLRKTLWELPPPSVREGRRLCLSSHHLLRYDEWSRMTANHMVGVNFCYVMLREDNLRKQASKRTLMMKDVSHVGAGSDQKSSRMLHHRSHSASAAFGADMRHDGDDDSSSDDSGDFFLPDEERKKRQLKRHTIVSGKFGVDISGLSPTGRRYYVHSPSSPDSGPFSDTSANSNTSEMAADLPWIDVGAKIGMRLLNSAHVHRAMASQDTSDRIVAIGLDTDAPTLETPRESSIPPSPGLDSSRRPQTASVASSSRLFKPVHSMWTSPGAAVASPSPSLMSDEDGSPIKGIRKHTASVPSPKHDAKPPLSPRGTSLPKAQCVVAKAPETPSNLVDQLAPPKLKRLSLVHGLNSMSTISRNDGAAGVLRARPRTSGAWDDHRARHSASQLNSWSTKSSRIRGSLQPGTKVAVPLFPIQPKPRGQPRRVSQFQMGTVVNSRRIFVGSATDSIRETNCLSVTLKLDKSYLRNAEFAELTFRVMDEWSSRYMPKSSKVPIGACVATTFGLGVLVGWRVEDDCHVVRSLWQRRGDGSAHAYLNRDAIHSTIEAGIGFDVRTKCGWGVTLAYVDGGRTFESGRFFVVIKEEGRFRGHVVELNRRDIYSCLGAQFIPVIEHIREAAYYQIQLDNYEALLREQQYDDSAESDDQLLWKAWSSWADILWKSFLKAVEEDEEFDEGVNEFTTSIIDFLERLDKNDPDGLSDECVVSDFEVECVAKRNDPVIRPMPKEGLEFEKESDSQEPGFWIVNDIFGGIFKPERNPTGTNVASNALPNEKVEDRAPTYYDRAFAVLKTIMKTVSIAKADCAEHPHLKLALAISYDFLIFVRTIVKVHQKNMSVHSMEVWKRALGEIATTFGPIKERLESIGSGIAQRMERQGRKAKIRVLKFVDTLLGDEKLLFALEQGEWDNCMTRLEHALVKSSIIQEESLFYFRKTGQFIYDHFQASMVNGGGAGTRNNEKLALFAHFLQAIASPRRSILKIFCGDDVLELFERILVRVYCREEHASRILTIHASNFQSLRQFRMLKDFSVAGRIWIPLLDAADEEFSWVVSNMPANSKEFMCPLSSLFSLCVAQFHRINAGDLSKDWLAFLLDDDAVRIIQDIDMKLILSLESFSRDVREMMEVLPYYPSIDEDILKLMDEVDLNEFLKEAADAIDDPDALSQFLREKVTIAIERFLNYLPKMSIPVERRDLGEGWVLTCRGEDGSDLTLSDVKIKRENLVCKLLGGETLFFPMFGEEETDSQSGSSSRTPANVECLHDSSEESILDHIRNLLLQAQCFGCWKPGIGGVGQPASDRYVAAVLNGLPVSSVLNCAIELWRNLEIDDDELLEIAVRDVSFQIRLQADREKGLLRANVDSQASVPPSQSQPGLASTSIAATESSMDAKLRSSSSFEGIRRRFNPRVDPTVLFIEMKKLTLHLDNFHFRIEKSTRRTVFDPVFEGRCMVSLHNISIRLRVECAKERVKRPQSSLGGDMSSPILQIQELSVELENMLLKVKDTGFGSDWLVNRAVKVFGDNITKVVEENLRDQILEQSRTFIDNLNAYFLVNPNTLLNVLGISMDDLEENVVWV